MQPTKPKTKLELLQEKWYAKLEKDGFEDIERNEHRLKSPSDRFAEPRYLRTKESNEAYFELCHRFLSEYKFKARREVIIWEYHANGLTVREIAATLKKAKVLKDEGRNSVHRTIKALRQIMRKLYFSEERR